MGLRGSKLYRSVLVMYPDREVLNPPQNVVWLYIKTGMPSGSSNDNECHNICFLCPHHFQWVRGSMVGCGYIVSPLSV